MLEWFARIDRDVGSGCTITGRDVWDVPGCHEMRVYRDGTWIATYRVFYELPPMQLVWCVFSQQPPKEGE